jgi:uncharacterized protein (TIGR02996 family)
MTTDETAFRAAIDAAPLDAAPWHVFADWLDEQGREEEAAAARAWTPVRLAARQWLTEFAARCGDHIENYSEVWQEFFNATDGIDPRTERAAYEEAVARAEAALVRTPFTLDLVLAAARTWVATSDGRYGPDYFTQLGDEAARDLMADPATREKFWECYQLVTGEAVPEDRRGTVFSCSC